MNGKNAVILAGLAAAALAVWWIARGRTGDAARGADDRGSARATDGRDAPGGTGGAGGSAGDRVHPIRPPIHVGAGGVEPAIEGPAEPAPPPVLIDAGPHPSLDDEFSAEARDPGWAGAHEREIKKRLATLSVDGIAVESTECRAHQCRISFKALDETAIGKYVARLEEDGGLVGYARTIVLEAITTTSDGQRHERVYVRFD